MHVSHRTARLVLGSSAFFLGLLGCVNELNPHTRELDADHTVAFVAQDDDLRSQLVRDEDGFLATPVIEREDEPFTRIAVRFDAAASAGDVVVEGRSRVAGLWGAWSPLTETFVDEGAHNAHLDVAADSDAAQLRFQIDDASTLSFLVTETFVYEPDESDADLEVDAETPTSEDLQGLAADGLVVTRSAWGARSRNCGPRHSPNRLTIHHTFTPNNDSLSMPARMRQIQSFHINSRGWCDVGYHFLVGQDGRIYQGRVENIVGAHAAGANTNNVGISFIGTFTSAAPSDDMMGAAAGIMHAMSRTYGISLDRNKVQGHRQVGSTDTSCPGDALYDRLSSLIERARSGGSGSGSGSDGNGSSTTAPCSLVQSNADSLNVRPDPNTNRSPIGTMGLRQTASRLETVTGQSISGNTRWYRINHNGVAGYISGEYSSCAN
jgi:hypothetical protein